MHKELSCNEAQKCAIIHNSGPMLVIAGPGSGKTFVITHRIEYLIQNHGISPEQILVITFTKAAALEMRERAKRLMGEQCQGVTFGTFHAVFYDIIKKSLSYGQNALLREEDKIRFLKDSFVKLEIETEDITEFLGNVVSEISRFKNSMIPAEEFEAVSMESEKFRVLVSDYQKFLQSCRKIDFDDMLCICHRLFLERPAVLAQWQEKYRYILIDEFQDVNPIQYDTIRLLAAPGNNLFIVGDDDQSIYGFRGAKPEIMLNFKGTYPNAEEVVLNVNYRSTRQIVESAGNLIAHNTKRFEKEITTEKGAGNEIVVREFETRMEEMEEILAYVKQGKYTLNEIAILTRTNSGAGYAAEKLTEYNIPFRMRDRVQDIYSHFIGEDIITYCKIASGEMAREHFYKICNRPKRYLSRSAFCDTSVSFEQLKRFYREKSYMQEILEKFRNDLLWISRMRPYAAIHYILKGVGYESFLESYAREHHMNPQELLERAEEIRERSRSYATFAEWFEGIREYQTRIREEGKMQPKEGITIATMHASKGLEFPCVFLPDVNEGITPYHKAVLAEEIEEERRMFYVAMTRAKEELFLFHVKMSHEKQTAPSRFLKELKQDC